MAVGVWLNGAFTKQQELFISYFYDAMSEFIDDDVILFDRYKVNKLRNLVNAETTKIEARYNGSWEALRKSFSDAIDRFEVNAVVVFKTDMRDTFRYGNEERAKRLLEGSYENDTFSSNFASTVAQIENLTFIDVASKKCNDVYQYAIDPEEPRLDAVCSFNNFRRLSFNKLKRQGSICMPYYEYELKRNAIDVHDDSKATFCFHATAVNPSRQWLADLKQDLELRDGYDVRISIRGEKKFSRQQQYMWNLANSRFTMVVKPYDDTSFSWCRFIEAASVGCLPLVMSDCNLQDIDATFPDIADIIRSELLVDAFDDVDRVANSMKESKRLQLVSDIMGSGSIKKVTDLDWLRARWQRLEGLGGRK